MSEMGDRMGEMGDAISAVDTEALRNDRRLYGSAFVMLNGAGSGKRIEPASVTIGESGAGFTAPPDVRICTGAACFCASSDDTVAPAAAPPFRVDIAHVDRNAIVHSSGDANRGQSAGRPADRIAELRAALCKQAIALLRLTEERDRARSQLSAAGGDQSAMRKKLAVLRADLAALRERPGVEPVWTDDGGAPIVDISADGWALIIDIVRGDQRKRYRQATDTPPIDRATDADFAPVPGWRSPVERVRRGRIDAGPMDGRAIAEMLAGGE